MKALVQRVVTGSVSVNGDVISSIGRGLVVLVGLHQDDSQAEMDYILKKILSVRLFEDENKKRWSKNVVDMGYELLCVSQFTLYYSLKGNKPDFHRAMKTEESKKFYEQFIKKLKETYVSDKVKNGVFGEMMQVNIVNDGPVTIELESIPRKTPSSITDAVNERR